MNMSNDKGGIFWAWLAGAAALGGLCVYVMSGPFGLGLIPDSMEYLQGARNLNLGLGFSAYDKTAHLVANSWYAPGLSALLSAGWFLGLGFSEWGRMLNTLFFGINIFLAGGAVFYVTRSRMAGMVTAVLFLTSVHLLEVHGKLVSEPLFLVLFLGWFWSMLAFMETKGRRFLYAAAVCAGLSVAARYSGIPVIIAGVLWMQPWKREEGRARDTGLFLLAAMIVPVWLLARNLLLTGHLAGGVLAVHMEYADRALIVVDSFSEWFLPSKFPELFRWAVLGFVMIGLVRFFRAFWGRFEAGTQRALSLTGVFTGVYIVLTLGVHFCSRTDVVLSHRLLAPVYALMIVGIGLFVPWLGRPWTVTRKLWIALGMIFFVLTALRAGQLAVSFYRNGFDLASRELTASRLVETLRSIDDHVPLYSNKPEAVWYFSGRPAVRIPGADEDARYFPAMPIVARDFKDLRGVAVIMDPKRFIPGKVWTGMKEGLGLQILMKDPEGDIYGIKRK
jgi:hypothetical protein